MKIIKIAGAFIVVASLSASACAAKRATANQNEGEEKLFSSYSGEEYEKEMQTAEGEQTNDQVVLLDARVDKRDDLPKLIVGSVEVLDLSGFTETPPLRLRMSPNRLDQRLLGELKTTLVDHPGDAPVLIQLAERTVRLPDQYSVDTSNGLVGELRALLGEDCVAV